MNFTDVTVIVFLPLAIFVILAVHEAGHYFVARLCGMHIDEITIGLGRKFFIRKDKAGTRWGVAVFPLWAHVQIADFEKTRSPWRKFFVVLAGPASNFLLPFVLFFLFFLAFGQPATRAVLTGVEIGGAAEKAGLKTGDEIIAVNGRPVHHQMDVWRMGYDAGTEGVFRVKRGEKFLDISARPVSAVFTDIDGIERKYTRLGVVWQHKPYKLKIVHGVNGIDTKDNEKKALEIIQKNLGRDAVVGLYSTDGLTHFYKVRLHGESNPHIGDPGHDEYKTLFLGKTRDDFYYRDSFAGNLKEAGIAGADMIRKVAFLPLQLFPVDPDILAPGSFVYGDSTWAANATFRLVYIAALGSVLMALINMLPLPRLDGSVLVFLAMEAALGRAPAPKQKALALVLLFLLVYSTILLFNIDNVPGYIDSRVKKIQEFMEDKN